MKSFTFSAAIIAVATAANARQNSRELLGRNAKFSGAYAGLDERELPDFADPYTPKGDSNQIVHELREGDDFIPKEVQAAEAAQRDPVIALTPTFRPYYLVVGIDWLVVLRGKVVRPELRRKGDNRVSLSSFGGLPFLRDEIVAFTEFVDDLVRISFRCVGIGKVGQLSFIQSSVGATELGISAEELARILPGIGGGSNRKDCC